MLQIRCDETGPHGQMVKAPARPQAEDRPIAIEDQQESPEEAEPVVLPTIQ